MIIVCLTSWCKAGLAGNWILLLGNIVTLTYFVFLIFKTKSKKSFFLIFLPIILISILFICSYSNPTYKILESEDWDKLSIEDAMSSETNIEKIIFASDKFKDIYKLSLTNPELSLTTFFDFKNRFFYRFQDKQSAVDKLIINYENLISLNTYSSLPTIAIQHPDLIKDFINKLFQISIGIILFLSIKTRKEIRKILYILCVNTAILAVIGIWQKLNYKPADDLLEILGIWNAPEPRYFFSTFTYKNHWSAFALLSICTSLGLLFHKYRRNPQSFLKDLSNIVLLLSTFIIMLSIPLSGSRSGSIFLILAIFLIGIYYTNFLRKDSFKKKFILFSTAIIVLVTVFSLTKAFHKDTWDEMSSNIKAQVEELNSGNLPLRIMLWKDLFNQIKEKPILGYGFNSYRVINPIFQSIEVHNKRNIVQHNAHQKFTPLIRFAHNDWLEKLSEFGVLGLLITIPYLFYLLKFSFVNTSNSSRIFMIGSLIFLLYSFVDFPSQTPACLLMFSVSTGCAIKYSLLSKNLFRTNKVEL